MFSIFIICSCFAKFKNHQRRVTRLRNNINRGFVSSNDQIVYTVDGNLTRTDSVISFESALRNSTAVVKESQNDFKLPTYDDYVLNSNEK